MALLDGRNWLEILSNDECWRLVRLAAVGRLAVVGEDGGPEIYPLNIAADGESVVFRTDSGSKLAALHRSPSVAMELDGLDYDARDGWSVLIVGRASEIGGQELIDARRLPLAPWAVGEKARWFRLKATRITGRRIGDRIRGREAEA